MLEKKPFVSYNEEEDRKVKPPIPVKLNDQEEEMISIGKYAFNKESKSGVLKDLAELGLKVLLYQLGVDYMHRITNPRRKVYEQEKPKYKFYKEQK